MRYCRKIETHSETDTYVDVERDNTLYYIIGVVAAILLAIGGWWFYSHSNNDNNPLGVKKPKWEKFVKVNDADVKLYKEANTDSPVLQKAVENIDSFMAWDILIWDGDKKFRGYNAKDYHVEVNTIFPVLDDSDGWYNIYIGNREITEAFLQKCSCEEVKPKPITKKVIKNIISEKWGSYLLVEKGEFANLYFEWYPVEIDDEGTVMAGVLTDGCIVAPEECRLHPQKTETTEVTIQNVSLEAYYNLWRLDCPEKYWRTSSIFAKSIFDVTLLTDSDIQKIVMAIRPQYSTSSKVYYYFPTVATDRFVGFDYSFSPAADVEVE